jgi:hypothetical protein
MAERYLEEEIRRTMLEVGRSCRMLLGRCKAVQSLADEVGRMGPMSRYAATVGSHLEAALSTISVMSGGKLSLDRVNAGEGGASERVVLRCVSSVMGRLGSHEAAPGRAAANGRPALQGHSRLISIPQILDFLASLGRTGTLEVVTLAETFKIVLDDGQVVHGESDHAPQGALLGDILVAQAALPAPALASFLKSNPDPHNFIGAALVDAGKVTHDQLQRALETQVRQLFVRLFASESATYSFYDAALEDLPHRVRMNTPTLLLESAVQTDGQANSATRAPVDAA